jgi:hypothetical protein
VGNEAGRNYEHQQRQFLDGFKLADCFGDQGPDELGGRDQHISRRLLREDVRHLTELKLWEISAVTFPMNESAVVTGVKGLSDDERARHLKAINEHRKAIDRHQQGIRTHLKEMLDGLDDTSPADDPALFEGDEEMNKAFLVELQKLAEQAAFLAAL